MKVTRGKASVSSDITVDQDLDFLTLWQTKRLATPVSGEALRKGNKDIEDSEVSDVAGITASKINLVGYITNNHIKSTAAIAISKLASNPFPSGMIALWHGTIANIPSGFVICDGYNSTPNLLTKFVQGVAAADTNPGTTGGAATHTLITSEMPAHTHKLVSNQVGTAAIGSDVSQKLAPPNMAWNSSTTGSDGAHENEPTFYDVAFLMKT